MTQTHIHACNFLSGVVIVSDDCKLIIACGEIFPYFTMNPSTIPLYTYMYIDFGNIITQYYLTMNSSIERKKQQQTVTAKFRSKE